MPASRWNSDLMELLSWFGEEELNFEELFLLPTFTRVDAETSSEAVDDADEFQVNDTIPSVLPILPLRGLVVYPETAVPLTIGQPRSVRLIDEVISQDVRLIGLVASKNP